MPKKYRYKLETKSSSKRELEKLNIHPSKRLGQNFIIDETYLYKILEFADISSGDYVLEIGPGLGALTRLLVKASSNVVAIEIDPRLCEHLREDRALVEADVKCADVLKLSLQELSKELAVSEFTVVSNVPYIFSSELCLWLFSQRAYIKHASLLLQREFAMRLAAEHGSRTYGSLSVLCRLYMGTELGCVIPGSAFFPATKVESMLIRLTSRTKPAEVIDNMTGFEKVVRAAFSHRRKTLCNSLFDTGHWAKDEIRDAIKKCALREDIRAEMLELRDFANLYRCLEL